ncbi:MAG: rRNA pseudouridine synthase [Pseudooceanicola sp.]|nr:rRNA pseudouridine synthase [Pseudooceanicola sp.]
MSTPTPPGDRIAKVLARAGVASRREAERMIAEGRIKVNGAVIDSPALNVTASDRVLVDGKPLPAAEPARLWLYHKPPGLVTTAKDDKGRPTIFDGLPPEMPRVMSVGRLDLNSEGLLLLTNDGALKRRLELPSTGWLRRYRVRINGQPADESFEPLRRGLTIGEERFQPMTVTLDRQQGANAWLTIGLREGKNREIRRAMEDLGFTVNRLIRVSYGPFQLGNLQAGEVEEIRRKVLRDQLGEGVTEPLEAPAKPKRGGPQRPRGGDKPARAAERGEKPARMFRAKAGASSPDSRPRSPKGGKPRPPARKGRSSP